MEIRIEEKPSAECFRLFIGERHMISIFYGGTFPTSAEAECLATTIKELLGVLPDMKAWTNRARGSNMFDVQRVIESIDRIRAAEKKAEGPKYFTVPIRGVAEAPPPECYQFPTVNHAMSLADLEYNKCQIDAALEAAKKKLEE